MVKFKLKGTLITALKINEKTGESGDIEVFVSKRYKTKNDRSVKAMINQIIREQPSLLSVDEKIIYVKSFESCDKMYGMDVKSFLEHAHELTESEPVDEAVDTAHTA